MKNQHHSINNPAKLTDQPIQAGNGECCDNFLLFAMRDNYHEFTLGIKTVLECLYLAETEGDVPPMPSDWWQSVMSHYHFDYHKVTTKKNKPV